MFPSCHRSRGCKLTQNTPNAVHELQVWLLTPLCLDLTYKIIPCCVHVPLLWNSNIHFTHCSLEVCNFAWIAASNLPWFLVKTLNRDFWTMLKPLRLWRPTEKDQIHLYYDTGTDLLWSQERTFMFRCQVDEGLFWWSASLDWEHLARYTSKHAHDWISRE